MSTQNENAGSKSLMKKTKAELVDIILRKDDVEKQLRKEKSDIELDFNKAKETIAKKDNKITALEKDIKGTEESLRKEQVHSNNLNSSIDDLTIENTELVSRNKKLLTWVFCESIIIIGLIILHFCL